MRRTPIGLLLFASVSVIFILSPFQEAGAQSTETEKCSPEDLKTSENDYLREIQPYLITLAEQYSGREVELRRKVGQRSIIFRRWLKMRCECNPPGLSLLEKTLCATVKPGAMPAEGAACLLKE